MGSDSESDAAAPEEAPAKRTRKPLADLTGKFQKPRTRAGGNYVPTPAKLKKTVAKRKEHHKPRSSGDPKANPTQGEERNSVDKRHGKPAKAGARNAQAPGESDADDESEGGIVPTPASRGRPNLTQGKPSLAPPPEDDGVDCDQDEVGGPADGHSAESGARLEGGSCKGESPHAERRREGSGRGKAALVAEDEDEEELPEDEREDIDAFEVPISEDEEEISPEWKPEVVRKGKSSSSTAVKQVV